MTEDGPVDVAVLELRNGDLAGEGTVGLVVNVLGSNLNVLAELVADELKVKSRRGNNNL